jgi:AcrR family transcriptional regulator
MRNEKVPEPVSCDDAVFHRNADDTRRRILCAAALKFSEKGYDGVGVREISAHAGVTAALINRYFGSKEKLFGEVLREVIKLRKADDFKGVVFSRKLAAYLLSRNTVRWGDVEFDPRQLFLRSVSSPVAVPIVAKAFDDGFLKVLSRRMGGRDARAKAAMISAGILGIIVMRDMMHSPVFNEENGPILLSLLERTIESLC